MCQARDILSFSYVWVGMTFFQLGETFFIWVLVRVGDCDLFWVGVGRRDLFGWMQVGVGKCGWVWVSARFITVLKIYLREAERGMKSSIFFDNFVGSRDECRPLLTSMMKQFSSLVSGFALTIEREYITQNFTMTAFEMLR